MVKVEIVEEKDQDVGNSPYASPSSSRTSSSVSLSSTGSDLDNEESFYERLTALVDIVPPTTRHKISSRFSKTASFFKSSSKVVGNIVWIVTTSALLVGLPLALSLEDEAKIVAQEKEQYAQQYGAQQVRGFQLLTACELPGMSAWSCPFIVTSPPPKLSDSRSVVRLCRWPRLHPCILLRRAPISPSRRGSFLPVSDSSSSPSDHYPRVDFHAPMYHTLRPLLIG